MLGFVYPNINTALGSFLYNCVTHMSDLESFSSPNQHNEVSII